ncbi:MAG: hypothetical protein DCC58_15560 [Chloroflexi bacterium]|nr:MAG: hypothetical protein DCC58_15560 [Chloroflexota bacterium]
MTVARIFLLPILLWSGALVVTRVAVASPEDCGMVTAASARAAARAAGEWLIRGQAPDGRYTYEYFPDEQRVGSDYNIVRHAGVTMSLYQLAGKLDDDAAMQAADLGLAWELERLVGMDDWLALSDDDTPRLGATALMVAGLAERRLATGDEQYDDIMLSLGNFLVKLQRPDGGFYVQWYMATNEPDRISTSIYFPGEAMWALALLHEALPGHGFDAAAYRAGDFIALYRDEVENIKWPPLNDHWASYGMAEMAEWGLPQHQIDYARRLAERFGFLMRLEAQNQADYYFDEQRGDPRRAASLGTWVEGTSALWRLSALDPRMADMQDDILERAACGAGMLIARQYPAAAGPELAGAWVELGVTRMDDQQHAISGLLYTADALEGRTERGPDPPEGTNP